MFNLREPYRLVVTAEPGAELHRIAVVSPWHADAIGGETPEEVQLGGHRPPVARGQHRAVE